MSGEVSGSEGRAQSSSSNSEEYPSRCELLSMVRKHSSLLKDNEDASDLELDFRFWRKMLDFYFVHGRDSKGRQDDLIFFVRTLSSYGYDSDSDVEEFPSCFVRRWAPQLGKVIDDDDSVGVDWRQSFYLNLITHTAYSVTVAICSDHILRGHHVGASTPLPSVYKVVKTVYASPSRVDFQLNHDKAMQTVPAYPDICFAVDDFDETFDAVILTETDHCYCVILNAHGGAAFPSDASSDERNSPSHTLSISDLPKVTLFSGFVNYKMVRDAFHDGRFGFSNLLRSAHASSAADRIYMKGPGGRGEVEVAVSSIGDQNDASHGPTHNQFSFRGLRSEIGSILHGAVSAAKQAYGSSSASDEFLPLRCCLMSISIPWTCIAQDLLFKGSPPLSI